jgi:hypothetical protein
VLRTYLRTRPRHADGAEAADACNGNNYFEVARILGHSTYRLTLDLYGHLTPEVQRQTAQAVDRFYRDLRSGNDPFQVIQGGVPGALDPALGRLRLA